MKGKVQIPIEMGWAKLTENPSLKWHEISKLPLRIDDVLL